MENNDLITIIVPVYNVEAYISRCVDSILCQSYKNIEIILSDDGSTDKSPSICDEYAKKDKRIKVLHYENKGLSEARNRGLRIAKGKLISFVDSDDWVDQNFILKLYYALKKTNSDIAECKFKKSFAIKEKGIINGQIVTFDSKSALNLLCKVGYEKHIVVWNKLYKKELFSDIEFPFGKLHEDEFTTHKVFEKAKQIAFLNDELYFYFQNTEGITKNLITSKRIDCVDAFLERIDFFANKNLTDCKSNTIYLLFNLFSNFACLDKDNFYNYDDFFELLNKKYFVSRPLIFKKNLNIVERFYFLISKRNVLRLKNNKIANYYYQRLKEKVYNLFHFYRFTKKPNFIKNIKSLRRENKKIAFLLASTEYLNYGDLAIGEAIRQYLSKKFSIIELSQKETVKHFEVLKKVIMNDDLIFLPGGGNMGDVWKDDEDIRRMVLKSFSKNKILIFPQSINYENLYSNYFNESVSLYNNPNLVLCVRDAESFKKAKLYYSNLKILLLPDSVFLLDTSFITKINNGKIAICFRDDKEQSVHSILKSLSIIEILNKNHKSFDVISTVANGNTSLKKREKCVYDKINEISSYKLVITDRLHCIIFCAISNTPCIALNNSNNKIEMFIKTWLPNVKFITYLSNDDKINEDSIFISKKYNNANSLLFEKFYELDNLLNEWSKI